MTIDGSVTLVRYTGISLAISGEEDGRDHVKTFSFAPVRGGALEIVGHLGEAHCDECGCSGLLLECNNGIVSDLTNWEVIGSSDPFQYTPNRERFQAPCSSSSESEMNQSFGNAMTNIWTSSGEKYAWFRTITFEGKKCNLNMYTK